VNRFVSVGWLIAESIPREPPPDERRAVSHQSRVELGGSSSVVVLAVGIDIQRRQTAIALWRLDMMPAISEVG
jgi:hypothetical protein